MVIIFNKYYKVSSSIVVLFILFVYVCINRQNIYLHPPVLDIIHIFIHFNNPFCVTAYNIEKIRILLKNRKRRNDDKLTNTTRTTLCTRTGWPFYKIKITPVHKQCHKQKDIIINISRAQDKFLKSTFKRANYF